MARETKAERERNRNEARVGLASNVLGITAGTAALVTASRNKAFRTGSIDDAGPVTRRIVRRSKGRIGPRGVGRLVRAGAAGAVGLQAANLAGDLVANRVLTRESQKKVSKMAMSPDGQSVIKAVYGCGETGVGVNLESVSKKALKCPDCDCDCNAKGKCMECGKDCRKVEKAEKKRVKCPNCELPCDKDDKCPMCGKDCSAIAKAARRYDSEADRQRRLGMYAGGGTAVAAVAGNEARRHFMRVSEGAKNAKGKKPLRGFKLKPKASARKTAILAGLAAAGAAVGAGSYARGVSRRNQPWA